MTITTQTNRARFTGNAVTTAFDFTFKALTTSDLVVSLVVSDVETVQTITTHYTVSLLTEGGTVTFVTAPANGAIVVIERSMAYTQPTDYANQGSFYPATHENSYDRATMQLQQIKDLIGRSPQVPPWTATTFTTELPTVAANRFVVINSGATGFTLSDQSPLADPTMRQDLAASSGSSLVGFIKSGTGAVASTVQAKLREYVSASDFGMLPGLGSGVNQTTFFDAAVAAVIASGSRRLHIPAGIYYLNTQPAAIASSLEIYGDGLNSTVLIRNYNGTANQGMIRLTPGASGFQLRRLAIDAASGTTTGCAISIVADASTSIDGTVFEDLWISTFGTDTWTSCIHIDGTLKITGAVGIRDTSWRNVHVFGASLRAVTLTGVVGFNWTSGGCYTAGGTGTVSILVDGTASIDSQYVQIALPTIQGGFTTGYATYVDVTSPVIGAIDNTGNSDYVRINGSVPSFASNWTNSGVAQPPAYYGSATYNPASLADGQFAEATVTCNGSALGDFATASFSVDTQGIILSARVSAANTCKVVFQNESGGVLDLASGTLRVMVRKAMI